MARIDIGDEGKAPEATGSGDGVLFLQVAVPVVVLSTIGQTAVVFIWNVPRLLCARKFDGGFTVPTFVAVQPGPLNQTSRAVLSICALSMVFMFVADAPVRMFETYVARSPQVTGAVAYGPLMPPRPLR